MDDEQLRERVRAWAALPGNLTDANYLGYPHPFDATLDVLCALYLDATPTQRRQLVALALPNAPSSREASVAANNLLTYIRHCGRRMSTKSEGGDTRLTAFALAAAALVGEWVDERDLAVALVFLRAGTTRAGISTTQALRLLDETMPEQSGGYDTPNGELIARHSFVGVWRSDEQTITRILAYHVGTG